MFALIWVILLLSNKVAGSGTISQKNSLTVSPSPSEYQSNEASFSESFKSSTTTLETKTNSKKPKISGNAAVKEGDTLNLTCTAEGFPGSSINWTKSGSNKSLNNETRNGTPTSGSAFLIISDVTAEHYGEYICNVTHQKESFTETINVTQGEPRISNSPKCECQSEVLPSSITVPLEHFHNITESQRNYLFEKLLRTVQEPEGIILALTGFVIGIILSPIICCLGAKCCRKKRKTSENLSENLEMVTTEAVPMMGADEAAVYDGIPEQEAAEGEAQPTGQSAADGDLPPKEVEYSNINFFAIKSRNPEEAEKTQDTTETEYAEIKTEEKRQENEQEDSEMLEGNEEKEVMIGEDNDATKAEKEGDEDVPLYSSVEEIMG